jgi:hemin uptake protein HemP
VNAPTPLHSLWQDMTPVHDATSLTSGGNTARIVLHGQTYTLRITRAGKLILTK